MSCPAQNQTHHISWRLETVTTSADSRTSGHFVTLCSMRCIVPAAPLSTRAHDTTTQCCFAAFIRTDKRSDQIRSWGWPKTAPHDSSTALAAPMTGRGAVGLDCAMRPLPKTLVCALDNNLIARTLNLEVSSSSASISNKSGTYQDSLRPCDASAQSSWLRRIANELRPLAIT